MSVPADKAVETVTIEIDGQSLTVPKNSMIIEAADAAGIAIPRFCYHRKLSVAANCRMCMVEVEKVPKPLPACATPVADGMKISTASEFARAAQKAVMEFLLINHPLDCPICDQGGECELQDVALEYGRSVSRFSERKRVVADKDIGPLVATEMTRCIHCTRCVRFMDEIAGTRELGGIGRGENTHIGTCVEHAIESELSGNIIDICPVGALTSKPFRFRARAWELAQHTAVGAHDCVGSNVWLHTRRGEVMRAVPRDNDEINESWISDRDRFSDQGLNAESRLTSPMIKDAGGNWSSVDWDVALEHVIEGLKSDEGNDLGVVVSPSATVEEMYLLSRIVDELGCDNIDHRLRQVDVSEQRHDPVFPALGCTIAELETRDAILLVGSNVRKEQPIAGHRIRKAAGRGARVSAINPVRYEQTYNVFADLITAPSSMVDSLGAVLKNLLESGGNPVPAEVAECASHCVDPEAATAIATSLQESTAGMVLLGPGAIAHPQYSVLRTLAAMIAKQSGARMGYLTEGTNAAGAYLAGAVPHRKPGGATQDDVGQSVATMMASPPDRMLLWGVEPERDCWDSAAAAGAVRSARFVVYGTSFVSEAMKQCADVLLPISPYSETSGTWINCEGRWQSFEGAATSPGAVRPGWKVLRVLGNLLRLKDFDYNSSVEVRDELAARCEDVSDSQSPGTGPVSRSEKVDGLERAGEAASYSVDPLCRRAEALQATPDAGESRCVHLAPADADGVGCLDGDSVRVTQNGKSTTVSLTVNECVPVGCVWLQSATSVAESLGPMIGPVQVEKA